MTKYLSTAKLISLLPELNLNEVYDQIKNDNSHISYRENGMCVFEYVYHDSESNKNYIQYTYHIETKTMYIRFLTNQTRYELREELTLHPEAKWLVKFKSPELDVANMMERGAYLSSKGVIYLDLINYAFHKLNVTTSTMKSIINAASIESDDPNEVFNIPDLGIKGNKRIGDYIYINGLDNGVLFNRIHDIIDHINNDQKQLHLLNYTASLVNRLSFSDLTELARLLNTANHEIQNATTYYIPLDAKDHYQTHITTIIAKIQERRNELMGMQVQMVPLSVWERDSQLRESIEQGAKVQVVLSMSLSKN